MGIFKYRFCLILLKWTDTDEELKEWKSKFDEKIAQLESKISKLEREMNDTDTKSSFLKETISGYIWEMSRLQNEAEVNLLKYNFTYKKRFKFSEMWILLNLLLFDFRLTCPWRMNEILLFKNFSQGII